MEKSAYYDSKIGIIKITYEKKVRKIELVDKMGNNEKSDITNRFINQISAYLDGRLKNFDLLDQVEIIGTDFQKNVWQALGQIPYGKTLTYKEIAQSIGKPQAIRAVGTAIGKNPIMIIIPCHRVIGSDGKLRGYAYGLDVKERLLSLEGVQI